MISDIDLNKVISVESDEDNDEDEVLIVDKDCDEDCDEDRVVDEDCRKNCEGDKDHDQYIDLLEHNLARAMLADEYDAYEMFCHYAHAKGFSVRKGKNAYFAGTTQLRSKLFTCSNEGLKELETGKKGEGEWTKSDGRTGCLARIWFTREKDGPLRVTKWIKEHNHGLVDPKKVHLLRSSRSIGPSKGKLIESHFKAGVRLIDSYNMIVEDCGGSQNVGYTKKDMYNYISSVRSSKIEAGDAQSVINHFKKKTVEEGLFYWDVQLDTEGRVANVFWRDSRSRIDYEFFGDFVTFDTTYRTNKYGLVCAPFVGVNHHHKNVMFACGFLSNETITSFKWLFETFLESMGGKQPKTIFTDQDPAMMNIIPKVFPESRHRLCQWHISQNAPSHLAAFQSQVGFKKMFHKCMNGCDSEEEFERTWFDMLQRYNASKNSWLQLMYKIKEKWSTAFSKDTFCAGLKATSRSESTNHVLNMMADRTTCLYEFVGSFEERVSKWREQEEDDDHYSNNSLPTLSIRSSEILLHASKMYTCTIYKFFEAEFKVGVGASDLISENEVASSVYSFVVELQSGGRGVVMFDANQMEIKCSCCKFETNGILCSHALKVLTLKNVHTVPIKYFLKRWCRNAKDRVQRGCDSQSRISISNESEMVFSNQWMRRTLELIMKGKVSAQTRLAIIKAIESAHETVDEMLDAQRENVHPCVEGVNEVGQNDENECHVLDPLFVKAKGVSNARFKKHWEKQRKRVEKVSSGSSKRRKNSVLTQEIGSSSRTVLRDVSNLIPSQGTPLPQMQILDMNRSITPNIPSGGMSSWGLYLRENPPFL